MGGRDFGGWGPERFSPVTDIAAEPAAVPAMRIGLSRPEPHSTLTGKEPEKIFEIPIIPTCAIGNIRVCKRYGR
jgi:hypothetical protein